MTPEIRGTLEKAADEAFAGMRAYHRSEIDHKRVEKTEDVLKKVYYQNALRLFPGIPRSGFPE